LQKFTELDMIVYLMAIRLILWNIAYKFEKKNLTAFGRCNARSFVSN